MSFTVQGGDEIAKRMNLNKLGAVPLRNFFSAYGQVVVTKSKKETPRFKGNLRGSLTFKMARGIGGIPLGIDVFSRSPYALYVHGFYDMKTKPHYPPIKALEEWSKAKGISPYLVQKAIGEKGTPLVPFFKIGIKKSEPDRKLLLAKAGLQITATWNAGRILPKR
jgi:hypothetical protein